MRLKVRSIILNVPVADVYAFCSRFEDLPLFITSLKQVRKIDETHFAITSLADGKEDGTILHIVLRVPERRIAWQAVPNNLPRGVLLFEQLSNRTTKVTVRLRSSMQSSELSKLTQEYLGNFKQFVEQRQ